MAINWNSFAPQYPQGGVIAQLPSGQNSSMDSLASGIMGGLQQGQQVMLNNQQMKMNDQGMKLNDLKLQGAQQEQTDKQNLRQASAKDLAIIQNEHMSNFEKTLYQQDRLQYEDFKKKQADIKLVLADVADKQADTKMKAYDVQQSTAASWGVIADAAYHTEQQARSQGASPEQAKQKAQIVFDLKFAQQDPRTQKEMIKNKLNIWNDNTNMALHQAAGNAIIEKKAAEDAKNASSAQKDDQTIIRLQEKASQSTLTASEQTLLDNARARQEAKARGAQQMTPAQKIGSEVAIDRLKTDNLEVKTHRANQQAAQAMLALSDSADAGSLSQYKTTLSNFANSTFGMKLDPKTPFNEVFNSVSRQFQVNVQSLMKGQTSDRDMKIMAELGPQLTNTGPGRKLMAKVIDYRANGAINQIAFENAWVNKNGNLDGMDEAWDSFLSTRNDLKPTKTGIQFDKYSRKDWSPFLDKDYIPPQKAGTAQSEQPSTPGYSQQPEPNQANNDPLGLR